MATGGIPTRAIFDAYARDLRAPRAAPCPFVSFWLIDPRTVREDEVPCFPSAPAALAAARAGTLHATGTVRIDHQFFGIACAAPVVGAPEGLSYRATRADGGPRDPTIPRHDAVFYTLRGIPATNEDLPMEEARGASRVKPPPAHLTLLFDPDGQRGTVAPHLTVASRKGGRFVQVTPKFFKTLEASFRLAGDDLGWLARSDSRQRAQAVDADMQAHEARASGESHGGMFRARTGVPPRDESPGGLIDDAFTLYCRAPPLGVLVHLIEGDGEDDRPLLVLEAAEEPLAVYVYPEEALLGDQYTLEARQVWDNVAYDDFWCQDRVRDAFGFLEHEGAFDLTVERLDGPAAIPVFANAHPGLSKEGGASGRVSLGAAWTATVALSGVCLAAALAAAAGSTGI